MTHQSGSYCFEAALVTRRGGAIHHKQSATRRADKRSQPTVGLRPPGEFLRGLAGLLSAGKVAEVGLFIGSEIHMDVVAIRIVEVDLAQIKFRDDRNAIGDVPRAQPGEKFRETLGPKGEMLNRAGHPFGRFSDLHQMDGSLHTTVKPAAAEGEGRGPLGSPITSS